MNVCYLGLGSNQNCPARQISKAIKSIRSIHATSVIQLSSFYWTKAWGVTNQPDFCNAVIKIITVLSPLELLKACQEIEKKQGRTRRKHWGPRIIDIDILLYGNLRISSPKLIIPHPYIRYRDFVLLPLKEINPNYS